MASNNCKRVNHSLLEWIENHLTAVLVVSVITVVVVPFIFSLPAFCRFFEVHQGHNVGDAIGGITAPIIGIISVLLLCITLKAQKDAEYRSSLENRIFQMMDLYQRNVDGMHSVPQNYNGRDVFKLINDQIENCVKDIEAFYDTAKLETMMKEEFRLNLLKNRPDIDLVSFVKLDIAYSTVYLGLRDEYIETLRALLSKRYQDDYILPLLRFLRLRLTSNYKDGYKEWSSLLQQPHKKIKLIANDIWDNRDTPSMLRPESREYPALSDNSHTKYYWGHEFRLGHLFRHLYSTVEYIDSQSNLTQQEKSDYVELLRTQLSNTEQKILMAHSISDLGGEWELFRKQRDGKQYITTYHMIKNIPQEDVYGVHYRKIYPGVDYELN